MARMRSIKPEFWDDRKLARATSRDARMLYVGMWNQADEHGRLNGDPGWLKGRVFPFDDDIDETAIVSLLDELELADRVVRYETEGDPFIFLPKLAKHQRLEPGKVPSRLPDPPELGTSVKKSEPRANESARRADESEPDSDKSALKHVAGGMEHVAGSRRQVKNSRSTDVDHAFDEFWSIYPRKVAKPQARSAFAKAIKTVEAEVVIKGAIRFRDDPNRDDAFTAHPSTWLNRESWNDPPLPARSGGRVAAGGAQPSTPGWMSE